MRYAQVKEGVVQNIIVLMPDDYGAYEAAMKEHDPESQFGQIAENQECDIGWYAAKSGNAWYFSNPNPQGDQ